MCGIFCLISHSHHDNLVDEFEEFKGPMSRRGPNSSGSELCELSHCKILFAASVLWLQGIEITAQPLKNDRSVFVYNGDVFGGSITESSRNNSGDTTLLFQLLNDSRNISQDLHNIQGPYSFVYLRVDENRIYFGRDAYGRRSLLIGKSKDKIIVTSVAKRNTKYEFVEVPSIGIFSLDLNTKDWQVLPWRRKNKNFNAKLEEIELFLNKKINVDSIKYEDHIKFSLPDETHLKLFNETVRHSAVEIFEILCNSPWSKRIAKLKKLLKNAIKKRICTQPNFCQNCYKKTNCTHSSVGILFSGGVDCAVLAFLADEFVDAKQPIDLINVAFDEASDYKTPDRLTGIETLEELRSLRPQRNWNFVGVDVPKEQLDSCRTEHIADLIYPLRSVLDDSLGCALWFASRAETKTYTSPCRILLVGMGADELFGGYTRHRAALQKRSWRGLHEALEEDWQSLPHRNLARDDRAVSDHGRQLRTPYLDEDVVEFVRNLQCWERTYPSDDLPRGVGEKVLLRSLAYHLGLKKTATLKKRALQFGSRIANSKEKAHEVSVRL